MRPARLSTRIQSRQLIAAINAYIEVQHSYHSMKFGFSSSEHATHKRRAGLQFYGFSSFRMIAAKVAQLPHRHEVLDKQSALPAPPSALWPGEVVKFIEFRKVYGAVRSTMRRGVVKTTMALLSGCRKNFEELAIVTQMLSAEGSAELLPGARCECLW